MGNTELGEEEGAQVRFSKSSYVSKMPQAYLLLCKLAKKLSEMFLRS